MADFVHAPPMNHPREGRKQRLLTIKQLLRCARALQCKNAIPTKLTFFVNFFVCAGRDPDITGKIMHKNNVICNVITYVFTVNTQVMHKASIAIGRSLACNLAILENN